MPTVGSDTTGGLSILSYSLEWNSGGTQESNWTSLVGDSVDNLVRTYTLDSLSTGTAYKFRYRVKNEVGWSDPSPVMLTYAGLEASKITVTTTEVDSTDPTLILFSWDQPADLGGLPLTSYRIEIKGHDGSFYEKTPECDGTEASVISSNECRVAHADLQSEPFELL